ncbi:MAG: conjugative transposon protein TraM [Bacteroidetes bacterium]|nr:conjugative transposon protein TraM [Bacteroidota bacterium]
MKINFKQPKYILPLILLPFLCLFFFVYRSSSSGKKNDEKQRGLNASVGKISGDVQKKQLQDKLDAYRNAYKQGSGITAVNPLPAEKSSNPTFQSGYSEKEQKMLDSINKAMKDKYAANSRPPDKPVTTQVKNDRVMLDALNGLRNRQQRAKEPVGNKPKENDPMDTFREQMAFLDSMNKANDPQLKAEKQKKEAQEKAMARRDAEPKLSVSLAASVPSGFNTVMPERNPGLIKVVIDENLTGYAGSRIRLRLLDDIMVGKYLLTKGAFLYALITGFSGQRVALSVQSILNGDKILPVKLEVYDMDGLAGLYVPASAFREFTRDLGTNTVQGVTIDGTGSGSAASQLAMSTASKLFESTSSAVASLIRKNKAKIKYNSFLYLIDHDALEKAQHQY